MGRFRFVQTEDGSPTLRFIADTGESEAMHSLQGAFAETAYIYGAALDRLIQEKWPPHVLSMGLGLGYNEVLTAAQWTATGRGDNDIYVESFEIDPDLRTFFAEWSRGGSDLPREFSQAYDEILKRCSAQASVDAPLVRKRLANWLSSGQFVLREALMPATGFPRRFSCFLFDAFSSKSTPELWAEDFLIAFLSRTANDHAVFSTYACTGGLKRALKTSGFELAIREGYASKRDCTFAVR
jgi:hypothetical protein